MKLLIFVICLLLIIFVGIDNIWFSLLFSFCILIVFHVSIGAFYLQSPPILQTPNVILVEEEQDERQATNVVQPDISIICDKKKLTERGCVGAPEMIIEVVSEYNPSHDYVRKLNLYNQFKVKEYWIVNPNNQTILIYRLKDNEDYLPPEAYTFNDKVKVGIFEDLIIDFA
ncbi:Uma2 family endonuclease [Caldicellulosiruptor hydrothermalis]|uniref:Uma2 family endonuclease n=1 Tax=Caldicellulosiruptor hydrothermalis TaxID=413888 RepID=UPI001EE68D75|nr:Uma2 family endonuclease [Caldicellulosiruptor hydrothermalis]